MINKILLLTGSTKHDVIQTYIDMAISEFKICTKRPYLDEYSDLIVSMVIEKYNKRHYEGVTSTSIGTGLTTTFIDGYSQEIKDQLKTLKINGRLL